MAKYGLTYVDRDLGVDRRGHGLRVDHLGSEVGQLDGLGVAHEGNDLSIGHTSGVGRVDSADIGPYGDASGGEHATEDGCTEVAPVTLERGGDSIEGGGDVACDHEMRERSAGFKGLLVNAGDPLLQLGDGLLPVNLGTEFVLTHHEDLSGVEEYEGKTSLQHGFGHNRRRPELTVSTH